jgi:hypothetical protein
MLSRPLLRFELRSGRVLPSYLDDRAADLVRALVLRYEACAGKPYSDLERALDGIAEADGHEPRLVRGLRRVIEEWVELAVDSPCEPQRIRGAVFALAAREEDAPAADVLRRTAEQLGLKEALPAGCLYAELRGRRRVAIPKPFPPVAEIICRYNFRLLQGLFAFAERVRVEVEGQVRAVYRLAKLHGLIVEVWQPRGRGLPPVLDVTGPLSLFHHTRKYGVALARFLPACTLASRFRLEATLLLDGRPPSDSSSYRDRRRVLLAVTEADRVLSCHRPPRLFDSKTEERLFRDFVALGSRWQISREESLVPVGRTVFLPDFTFRLRSQPAVRVDLEVIGFWTRDYLARKRWLLSRLGERRLIVCVDQDAAADLEDLPQTCIRFKKRVPAERVLEVLEGIAGGPAAAVEGSRR